MMRRLGFIYDPPCWMYIFLPGADSEVKFNLNEHKVVSVMKCNSKDARFKMLQKSGHEVVAKIVDTIDDKNMLDAVKEVFTYFYNQERARHNLPPQPLLEKSYSQSIKSIKQFINPKNND
jgi:hypothetical protein